MFNALRPNSSITNSNDNNNSNNNNNRKSNSNDNNTNNNNNEEQSIRIQEVQGEQPKFILKTNEKMITLRIALFLSSYHFKRSIQRSYFRLSCWMASSFFFLRSFPVLANLLITELHNFYIFHWHIGKVFF